MLKLEMEENGESSDSDLSSLSDGGEDNGGVVDDEDRYAHSSSSENPFPGY